jgi:hypothetical protein
MQRYLVFITENKWLYALIGMIFCGLSQEKVIYFPLKRLEIYESLLAETDGYKRQQAKMLNYP